MLVFVYMGWYSRVIQWIIPGELALQNIMLHIALAHSVFNVSNSMIFFPLIPALQKLVERLIKPRGDVVDMEPQYLEKHLLDTPSIALEQSKKEIIRMLSLAGSALTNAYELYRTGDTALSRKVARREQAVDNLQAEITRYLIDISMEGLEEDEAEQIPVFIHSVNDIERISDNAIEHRGTGPAPQRQGYELFRNGDRGTRHDVLGRKRDAPGRFQGTGEGGSRRRQGSDDQGG